MRKSKRLLPRMFYVEFWWISYRIKERLHLQDFLLFFMFQRNISAILMKIMDSNHLPCKYCIIFVLTPTVRLNIWNALSATTGTCWRWMKDMKIDFYSVLFTLWSLEFELRFALWSTYTFWQSLGIFSCKNHSDVGDKWQSQT